MLDLTRHPRLLRYLSFVDRVVAFLRRHSAGKKEAARHLTKFYETIWHETAARLDAQIEPLGHGVFEIRLGEFRTRVQDNSTAIDDLVTHCVVRTKPVMYHLLARHGLPIPRFVEFTVADMREAVAFLEESERDCVVKPAADTGGGLAVTTGIRTRWQLARAAWVAAVHGGNPLIEEQVEGENYRLLYLDGRLLDVVKRQPPTVVGDGVSSIRRLVQKANSERLQRGTQESHGLLTLDMEMRRTLAREGLSLRSVPAQGTVITLKTAINENRGPDNITATDLICEAIIADGARAAAIAGVRLAGVDIITRDPAVPLRESGGVILEVNSPPGYYWHYHKRGEPFPLADYVLEALLKSHAAGISVADVP